jgi:SAM-dependent methyltransferase
MNDTHGGLGAGEGPSPSAGGAAGDAGATVRRSFGLQAGLFTGSGAVFAAPSGTPPPAFLGPTRSGTDVLDVACGAGHVAEQVAPHVRRVVGLDLTRMLLRLAAERLAAAGHPNVFLCEGDAQRLPFPDGVFDLVYSRAALHHFTRPGVQVAEMARVCRPGGVVAVSDMVAPGAELRGPFDAVHRLIDPSHASTLLHSELVELIDASVGQVVHMEVNPPSALPLERILTPVADRAAVFDILRAELAGGPRTGFRPSELDGELHVSFTTATARAIRLA